MNELKAFAETHVRIPNSQFVILNCFVRGLVSGALPGLRRNRSLKSRSVAVNCRETLLGYETFGKLVEPNCGRRFYRFEDDNAG